MKLLENLGLLALILAAQGWCAACAVALLRVVQLLGLEADTALGRAVAAAAALGGVAFAIWTMSLVWNRLRRKRCAPTKSNA